MGYLAQKLWDGAQKLWDLTWWSAQLVPWAASCCYSGVKEGVGGDAERRGREAAGMGRMQVTVGTRYVREGRAFVVRQVLRDGGLLVEDQTEGGQGVVSRDELWGAWSAGALTFMGAGRETQAGREATMERGATLADFHLLPEGQRAEAWRRYALIRPLLALPAGERTREAIVRYLAGEEGRQRQGDDHAGDAGDAGDAGGATTRRASRASVERYLRAYEGSGGDIRSLVPGRLRQGGREQSRLKAEVEGLVQGVLAECRAAPAQRTVRDVYLMIVARVRAANGGRAPADLLPVPGRSTIYRRVGREGPAAVLRRRPGPGERRAVEGVWPGPRVTRPLERVELDHTVLDLIVVDEEDRLPIGRPTVTLALDVYSGLPAGVQVGFEPAGYGAAMRCLLHAILPKEDAQARYGAKNGWPVYGLPETLVVDRAPHLVGGDLADACGQLGIRLEPSPVKRPWFKGAVERQFRTHNTGLVHGLPGTTFSNILERGEYDAAGMACISLTRFREILHVYLLDVYGQEWNRGVGSVPAQRWAEAVAGGWTPALHPDAAEMRLLLGRGAVRTIQRAGIDHLSLRYQSRDLDALRRALPAGTAVALKYDPEDLGALHVQIPAAQRGGGPGWLRVPALHQEYARGLSLWKHRVIQGQARVERGRAVNIEALAEAKGRIQKVVEEEFRRTRRGRRRVAGARYLGVGAAPAPAVPAAVPLSGGDEEAEVRRRLEEVMATWDMEATLAEPGWGVTYAPPRDEERGRRW